MLRFFLSGTVLLFSLSVFAQEGSPAPQATVQVQKDDELPDAQKREKVTYFMGEIMGTQGALLGLLKQAREEKDAIKAPCVNDKLEKTMIEIRKAQQAEIAFNDALANKNSGAVKEAFRIINSAFERVATLRREAEQCGGEKALASGKTKVEVEIDKEKAPRPEPTPETMPSIQKPSEVVDQVIERPAAVSPSK